MKDRSQYNNKISYIHDVVRHRNRVILTVILTILLILTACAAGFYEYFKVRNVTVNGSTYYTNEEIENIVMQGFLGHNSVVLSLRYSNTQVQEVPFIEKMDVTVLSHDSIEIDVYEKPIIGYVNYLGTCMYFDREGTIVDSSEKPLEGIPEVTGLKFDHIVMNEKLPVEDTTVFGRVLNISQILDKYSLTADKIYFNSSYSMILFFGDVQVNMGDEEYTEEKVANLSQILPALEGKKGTLDLASYTPDTTTITFTEDDRS